jgi:hypothetical protein
MGLEPRGSTMKGFRSKASSPDYLFCFAREVTYGSLLHGLQGAGKISACLHEAPPCGAKAGERVQKGVGKDEEKRDERDDARDH